jgi:hypothetical protein
MSNIAHIWTLRHGGSIENNSIAWKRSLLCADQRAKVIRAKQDVSNSNPPKEKATLRGKLTDLQIMQLLHNKNTHSRMILSPIILFAVIIGFGLIMAAK